MSGNLFQVFSYMRPPRDLQKIDRITTAAAHLWWRTHDLEEPQEDETLRWAMEAGREGCDAFFQAPNEVQGVATHIYIYYVVKPWRR